jgi:hypothetical protein
MDLGKVFRRSFLLKSLWILYFYIGLLGLLGVSLRRESLDIYTDMVWPLGMDLLYTLTGSQAAPQSRI